MATKAAATVEDLYHVPEHGKAEIVNGELVLIPPTGCSPGYAGDEIFISLREYTRSGHKGRAVGDNRAFIVELPNRLSFSPCAAYYLGPPAGMGFFQGAPIFAVEVKDEDDYQPTAARDRAAKRADYFAAGTLVVWDIDLLGEDVVRVYRASDPTTPTIFRRGEMADAEPAVPGWRMAVDDLFVPSEPEEE